MKNDDKFICGLYWEQIKLAQAGKPFREYIDLTKLAVSPPTEEDRELLAKHGMNGLKEMGFWGVIDRLTKGF